MIDLYEDKTYFVSVGFFDFCAENEFSVRLFHCLRRMGLASADDVINFFFCEFDKKTYSLRWGKRTTKEFETTMLNLLYS